MLPESARAELAYTLVSSLNVPADAKDIEKAVKAAATGEIVCVPDDLYRELATLLRELAY